MSVCARDSNLWSTEVQHANLPTTPPGRPRKDFLMCRGAHYSGLVFAGTLYIFLICSFKSFCKKFPLNYSFKYLFCSFALVFFFRDSCYLYVHCPLFILCHFLPNLFYCSFLIKKEFFFLPFFFKDWHLS